jgi:3-polyprenyl-4-hydroxybenzoate decarboxylase
MNLTVAITGASGAVFGREMLRALEADPLCGLGELAAGAG